MPDFPAPREGITLTHFIVSDNVERASHVYSHILGGEVLRQVSAVLPRWNVRWRAAPC